MNSRPEPIKAKKLSHIVEDRLLELIRTDNLSPGDYLPSERELMDQYQVGRPAIREAMQSLQRMGLIEIRHGERPKVVAPDLDSLVEKMGISMQHVLTHSASSFEHLKEARATLEAEMARIAAQRRTAADVEALEQILTAQKHARQTPERFLELDGEFHRRVAEISRNPIFQTVTYAVFNWLRAFHADLVRKPGLESLTLDEHEAILSAISDGDDARAADAMRQHLTRANELYSQDNMQSSKS